MIEELFQNSKQTKKVQGFGYAWGLKELSSVKREELVNMLGRPAITGGFKSR